MPVSPQVSVAHISLAPSLKTVGFLARPALLSTPFTLDMATETQAHIASAGSTATLDIQEVLSSFPHDPITSTRPSFASIDSCSLDDVPPYPSRCPPLFLLNGFCESLLAHPASFSSGLANSDKPRPLITSPTPPRLKVMLIEKISLEAWAVSGAICLQACINHMAVGICMPGGRHRINIRRGVPCHGCPRSR